jgi:hypothetical protein
MIRIIALLALLGSALSAQAQYNAMCQNYGNTVQCNTTGGGVPAIQLQNFGAIQQSYAEAQAAQAQANLANSQMIQGAIAARRQAQADADAAQVASDMEVRRRQDQARAIYTKEALAVSQAKTEDLQNSLPEIVHLCQDTRDESICARVRAIRSELNFRGIASVTAVMPRAEPRTIQGNIDEQSAQMAARSTIQSLKETVTRLGPVCDPSDATRMAVCADLHAAQAELESRAALR